MHRSLRLAGPLGCVRVPFIAPIDGRLQFQKTPALGLGFGLHTTVLPLQASPATLGSLADLVSRASDAWDEGKALAGSGEAAAAAPGTGAAPAGAAAAPARVYLEDMERSGGGPGPAAIGPQLPEEADRDGDDLRGGLFAFVPGAGGRPAPLQVRVDSAPVGGGLLQWGQSEAEQGQQQQHSIRWRYHQPRQVAVLRIEVREAWYI